MAVNHGYRQTEIGPIPEDWEVRPLSQVSTFLDGRRRPVKDSDRSKMRGTIPYYGASGIVDYVNDFLFDEDLILLGEDGENIVSRNTRLAFRISGKTWVNNHAHVIKPNREVNIGFLCDYLESLNYEQYNSGTAQPKLNKQTCNLLPIAIPSSLVEQEAIAEALSDADAWIESLEQLITKKRLIKQGAMQELLTGKRRLPGFSADWSLRRLGDVLTVRHGKDQKLVVNSNGRFPILATGGEIGRTNSFLCSVPSVLIGRKGTINKPQYMDSPFWSVDTLFYTEVQPPNNAKFLYYRFWLIDWLRLNEASGVPSLNSRTIESLEIRIPAGQEQFAISEFLTHVDLELEALEAKLAKARRIKQGMMQELLTGRIRLV